MSFNKDVVRRFLSAYIVILLLFASFSIIFVPLYSANINGTQPGRAQTSPAQTSTGNTGGNSDDDDDSTGNTGGTGDDEDDTTDDNTGDDDTGNNNGNSNNGGSTDNTGGSGNSNTGNNGNTPVANNNVKKYETTSSSTDKKTTTTSNPTTEKTKTTKKALRGEKLEIIPENSVETGIRSIDITAAVDLEDLELTVTKLEEKPIEITEPLAVDKEKVCKYLEIKLTTEEEYMKNEYLDLTNIEFEVTKEWIDENNIDRETIKLYRYQDDNKDNEWEWMELETELVDTNDEYTYYYKAITPGFSTFAIVGSEVVEISESYSTSGITIPWTFIIGGTILTIIFLTAILFKTGYIYFGDEKNSIKKKRPYNK